MKHFIVELTYTVPADQLSGIVGEHRAFLQTGYDQGMLLFSGPQNPKVGGMVIARANSLSEIQSFFNNDPYQKNGLATYRFVEFEPVKYQGFLKDWL